MKEISKSEKVGLVLSSHLANLFAKVSATVIGDVSNLKNALWKWGGHPQVLQSAQLLELEGQLLQIGRSIESSQSSGE